MSNYYGTSNDEDKWTIGKVLAAVALSAIVVGTIGTIVVVMIFKIEAPPWVFRVARIAVMSLLVSGAGGWSLWRWLRR